MVIDIGYFTKVLKNIIVVFITLLLIYLSFKLAIFYIPFLIGFIISLLIEPIIKYINTKTKLTRKVSAIIVLISIFIILISFIIFGIITLISETTNLLQNLNSYIEKIYNQIQLYVERIDLSSFKIPNQIVSILETTTNNVLEFSTNLITNLLTSILKFVTKFPIVSIYVIITILSTYFICTDKLYILDQFEHHFPKRWVKKISYYFNKIIKTFSSYLKAEAILILISFIEILIGLYVFKWMGLNVPYPLLAAIGIGFVDALPILRRRNSYDTMGNYF